MNWKKVAEQLRLDVDTHERKARATQSLSARDAYMATACVLGGMARAIEAGLMTGEEIAREELNTALNMAAICRAGGRK